MPCLWKPAPIQVALIWFLAGGICKLAQHSLPRPSHSSPRLTATAHLTCSPLACAEQRRSTLALHSALPASMQQEAQGARCSALPLMAAAPRHCCMRCDARLPACKRLMRGPMQIACSATADLDRSTKLICALHSGAFAADRLLAQACVSSAPGCDWRLRSFAAHFQSPLQPPLQRLQLTVRAAQAPLLRLP
jgi:hypothetical protein